MGWTSKLNGVRDGYTCTAPVGSFSLAWGCLTSLSSGYDLS